MPSRAARGRSDLPPRRPGRWTEPSRPCRRASASTALRSATTLRRVLEGEGPRDAGGGDLALGVADDGVGRDPVERQSSASETITANSAGWTTSTRLRGRPSAASTSRSDQSRRGAPALPRTRRSRGEDRRGRRAARRPSPATGSPGRGRRRRAGRRGIGPARRHVSGARRRRVTPGRQSPRAALAVGAGSRRGGRAGRGRWRGSRRRRPGSARGRQRRCSARRSPDSRSASSPLAERTQWGRAGARRARPPARARTAGASSRIRWALVPLIPNEETPARRGWPLRLPTRAPASAARPRPRPSRRAGVGCVDVQGRAAARRGAAPATILITPATPAAAWVWPMFDFDRAEPQRPVAPRSWP